MTNIRISAPNIRAVRTNRSNKTVFVILSKADNNCKAVFDNYGAAKIFCLLYPNEYSIQLKVVLSN